MRRNNGLPTYMELLEYYDSTCGCYVIDRHPSEVSKEWIVQNCWRLEPIDNDLECDGCNTDLSMAQTGTRQRQIQALRDKGMLHLLLE